MPTTNKDEKSCQSCKHFIRQNNLCEAKKSFAWDENGKCAKWASTALDSLFGSRGSNDLDSLFNDMFGSNGPFGEIFKK